MILSLSHTQEEPYAWGNPAAIHTPILDPESNQPKLAAAAWRWRCSIVGDGESDSGYDGDHHKKQRRQQRRPFEHMTALIHAGKERAKSFTRLIEAGGGQVISARCVGNGFRGRCVCCVKWVTVVL